MPKHMTKETEDKIADLFFQGKTYAEIAEIVGCGKKAVFVHVSKMKEDGRLPAGWTKHEHRKPRQPRQKTVTPFNLNKRPEKLPEKPDGIIVKCTRKVSEKCVYGVSHGQPITTNLCNYILCEGHSRGCLPEACDKYAHRTKDNPLRMSNC